MFFKIEVLEDFAIFTGKYFCWSLFLIKLQAFRNVTSLKRNSNTVFFCEYCEVFENYFFIEHLPWLLLKAAMSHDQEICNMEILHT